MRTHFYDLRFNRYEWARIWVTSDGMISICSDYGNYGYWFVSPGCEIRKFLIRCDPGPSGYMAIKLSDGKRAYDDDGTLKAVKEYICGSRLDGNLTREEARYEWELLEQHGRLEHTEEFATWYQETKIDCAYEFRREQLPGQLQGFMEHCWPVFVAAVKKELSAEQAHAEAYGTMQEMGV